MEIQRINIADLEKNVGQIDGLPVNPRQWSRTEIDRIAKSLKETPELFEARPIIAVYHNGKYVILGGNLRYEGARANKAQDVPCVVVPEDMPIAKMKEIVIKDNGTFGQWDFDELANNWDDLPLVDWGVPAWNAEEEIDLESLQLDSVAAVGKSETGEVSITFVFRREDAEKVAAWMKEHSKEELVNKIVEICQIAEVK